MDIHIDGFQELREALGDVAALELLTQTLAKIPDIIERDMISGGRTFTELDLEHGTEVVHLDFAPSTPRHKPGP